MVSAIGLTELELAGSIENLVLESDIPWTDHYFIAIYVAVVSLIGLLLHFSLSKPKNLTVLSETEGHVQKHGGKVIYACKIARLAGSVTLSCLAVFSLLSNRNNTVPGFNDVDGRQQLALTIIFIYASILSFISLTSVSWSQVLIRHVNGVLCTQMAIYCYRDVYPLATYTLHPLDQGEGPILWAKMSVLFVTSICIPLFVPRVYVPFDPEHPMTPNSEQVASLWSSYFFMFLDDVIYTAYKSRGKHLDYEKLPPLVDYCHAHNLRKRSFPEMDVFSGAKDRHIVWGMIKVYRFELSRALFYVLLLFPSEYLGAVGVNRLLSYMENPEDAFIRPWVWIILLFAGPALTVVTHESYVYYVSMITIENEAIITQLVFEHALRIRVKAEVSQNKAVSAPSTPSPGASGSSTPTANDAASVASSSTKKSEASPAKAVGTGNLIGKLNNLVTTDLANLSSSREILRVLVYVPIGVTTGVIFLYLILDWAAFVGLGVMILLFPIPGLVSKAIQKVRRAQLLKTDARVQRVTETMNVLRMVKMFGWESKLHEKIDETREEELEWVRKGRFLEIVNGSVNYILPAANMLAAYTVYTVVMGQRLTPAIVFSSSTIFSHMSRLIRRSLMLITSIITGKVSLDRINDFLHDTELLDAYTNPGSVDDVRTNEKDIGFRNATFAWSADETETASQFKLHIDSLLFRTGCINLIAGPTGSGKTSILLALLGEMHFIKTDSNSWFNLPRKGGIAYVAQEGWVLNETIKKNVLFGLPFDEERYKKVLHQCALEPDIALLEAGDETEVGERGLTLSGGQRARLTLARAIYSTAQIILLDDILAALDVHTSTHIVRKCLAGDLVENRTILLVTHNVAIAAPVAGYCIDIKAGRVWSQGTVSDVLASDSTLIKKVEQEEEILEKAEVEELDLPAKSPSAKASGKLIVAEEINTGHVSWKALKPYILGLIGAHPILIPLGYCSSVILSDIFLTLQTWYLGHWSMQYQDTPTEDVSVVYHLSIYAGIMALSLGWHWVDFWIYMSASIRASRVVHNQLVSAILGTTTRWLDITPVSRIIARCTQDITALDGMLPRLFINVCALTSVMMVEICAIVIVNPEFIFVITIVSAVGYFWGQVYMAAQLAIKREMSNAKSPILAHFGAAMAGLVSLRAYGAQNAFIEEAFVRTNKYIRAGRPFQNLICWISLRLDCLGGLFTALLATYMLYFRPRTAGTTGFSLAQASIFALQILWWVSSVNRFELAANSLERIQHFVEAEQEEKPTKAGEPPAYWPSSGSLRVENLGARYSPDGPKVLQNFSFEIKSGQRIGVVGRTGSGKSSLTLSLLRCIYTEGEVYLDGLPTHKMNLQSLRTKITIIPQMPELLAGSLRYNLDPFELYDDLTLNNSLRAAGLFSLQAESGEERITLDSKISAGGANLSIGERQILALARALVRGSKLLILDEATSAIDYKTDAIIQKSLRTELRDDVTVITIAHRLQTIMDADKILVLDAGRLIEFGTPKELLAIKNGKLRSLVDESVDKKVLHAMAEAKK
ncbi:P-loop containing nucleoside triphosphate hydrolase protein [Mycena floridula]|nr:P-loop containing nucleoside triphosphate hydrolase protein [Mycena floridula]